MPVQLVAAAINFNKYPIKFVDRQLINPGEKWITSKNLGPLGAEECNLSMYSCLILILIFQICPQTIQRTYSIWFAGCLSFQALTNAKLELIRMHVRSSIWGEACSASLPASWIPYLMGGVGGWSQYSEMGFMTKIKVGLQESRRKMLPPLKSKESWICSAKHLAHSVAELVDRGRMQTQLLPLGFDFSYRPFHNTCGESPSPPPPADTLLSNKICHGQQLGDFEFSWTSTWRQYNGSPAEGPALPSHPTSEDNGQSQW